jgi:REP element-mobilizing transposase RayT
MNALSPSQNPRYAEMIPDIVSWHGTIHSCGCVDVPHHVTQRGNGRRFVLDGDADRTIYLKLLRENIVLYGVALIGYCLMSNHIHLIAIPHKVDGLAQALKQTHGRYASYCNAAHQSNGHVWQGRYYSCPLDQSHLWEALRYTQLNPVRAGLVLGAELWPWSSAACHCGAKEQRVFDAGAVAQPLDQHYLAGVPQRRGDGSEVGRHSSTHAYRPASGH